MRKFLIAILFSCPVVPLFAQASQKTFTLHDGELDSGSVMRRYDIFFDLNKATLRPEDSIVLDSIADWIILHREFIIEVGNHTDHQNATSSSNLTAARARSVANKLFGLGVPVERIISKGYGDVKNIIPQSAIAKETSKAKKDSLQRINRRTEFKIYRIDPKLISTFTLQDSIFWPGQVLRDARRIHFDLSKASIRPESQLYLDTIAIFLVEHPNLKVEIDNHTDSRGSRAYSIRLSEMRARAVKEYLLSKGIDPARLTSKGFEGSQPIIPDQEILLKQTQGEKEALYQQNRRTEFKIISVR